jgi:hypothetical protein
MRGDGGVSFREQSEHYEHAMDRIVACAGVERLDVAHVLEYVAALEERAERTRIEVLEETLPPRPAVAMVRAWTPEEWLAAVAWSTVRP